MANPQAKGRPELPDDQKRTQIVPVRLTESERADCEKAAAKADQRLSEWIRERLVSAAKRALKN